MTLRTPATGVIGPLFKAARVALPPNVRDASATCRPQHQITAQSRRMWC
jgi:hypothetical protein